MVEYIVIEIGTERTSPFVTIFLNLEQQSAGPVQHMNWLPLEPYSVANISH
uniref:Uncharacterized protein n=1 Tax=Manihot esculenta TaxID=3983 RepID=A0A2C9WBB1_MANES